MRYRKERDTQDKKLRTSFLNIVYNKWETKIVIPNWVEHSASNSFVTRATLQVKLLRSALTPYYDEYMETHMDPPAGHATIDAPFRWLGGSRRIGRDGRRLQKVR